MVFDTLGIIIDKNGHGARKQLDLIKTIFVLPCIPSTVIHEILFSNSPSAME